MECTRRVTELGGVYSVRPLHTGGWQAANKYGVLRAKSTYLGTVRYMIGIGILQLTSVASSVRRILRTCTWMCRQLKVGLFFAQACNNFLQPSTHFFRTLLGPGHKHHTQQNLAVFVRAGGNEPHMCRRPGQCTVLIRPPRRRGIRGNRAVHPGGFHLRLDDWLSPGPFCALQLSDQGCRIASASSVEQVI